MATSAEFPFGLLQSASLLQAGGFWISTDHSWLRGCPLDNASLVAVNCLALDGAVSVNGTTISKVTLADPSSDQNITNSSSIAGSPKPACVWSLFKNKPSNVGSFVPKQYDVDFADLLALPFEEIIDAGIAF